MFNGNPEHDEKLKAHGSFVVFTEWKNQIDRLTEKDKALLLDAMFEYHTSGQDLVPPDDNRLRFIFDTMKDRFDANAEAWLKKCATYSNNAKQRQPSYDLDKARAKAQEPLTYEKHKDRDERLRKERENNGY